MRKTRKNSPLWEHLRITGVLERGIESEIKQAKKLYRKSYLKTYKKQHKNAKREYSATFHLDENAILIKGAQNHGLKPAQFLKSAALAYCGQYYLVSNKPVVDAILQTLLRYETAIERIADNDKGAWYKPDRNYQELEKIINTVRSQVQEIFMLPPSLEDALWKALRQNPKYFETIQKILAEYDSQIHVEKNRIVPPVT